MSRITAHFLTQQSHPCGRLVVPTEYDSSTQILEFLVPSDSRKNLVYGLELDAVTGEIACLCEDALFRRNSKNALIEHGTYLEQLVAIKREGRRWWPTVTRNPSGLCKHARKCREALRRRGLMPAFKAIEKHWTEILESEVAAKSA